MIVNSSSIGTATLALCLYNRPPNPILSNEGPYITNLLSRTSRA